MAEAIAMYDPGADITCVHTAGSPGGRCVSYPVARNAGGPSGISDSGDGLLVVTAPAANAMIFGVTSHDVAAGGTVNIMRAPKVVPIECAGNVAVGAFVSTATDGRINTSGAAAGAVGRALSAGSAGTFAAVELFSGPATSP